MLTTKFQKIVPMEIATDRIYIDLCYVTYTKSCALQHL